MSKPAIALAESEAKVLGKNVVQPRELSQDFKDKFVKNLQGKDFILYGGLITLAHAEGCKGITSRVVQFPNNDNDWMAVVEATVTDANGNTWSGIGDADGKNCNSKIAMHRVRMAETRAKGRALRDMLGIDILMDGEMVDPYEREMITQTQTKTIKKIMEQRSIDKNIASLICYNEFGVKTAAKLTSEEAQSFIAMLELYEDTDVVEEEKPAKKKLALQIEEDDDDAE
ncbi:hypothetical protein D3C85_1178430 [compost metagenome]